MSQTQKRKKTKKPKFLKTLGIAFLILVIAILLGKDIVLKYCLEIGLEQLTGLKVKMESLHFSLLNTHLSMRKLKLFNPVEFETKFFAHIPKIFLDFELRPFLEKKLAIEKLEINLRDITIERNREGRLNYLTLKTLSTEEKGPSIQSLEPMIKYLKLSIDKIILIDYAQQKKIPYVQVVELNLKDAEFRNINSVHELVSLILTKVLTNAIFKGMGIELDSLLSDLQEKYKPKTYWQDLIQKLRTKLTPRTEKSINSQPY